jgi:Nif-specific regulatory protein
MAQLIVYEPGHVPTALALTTPTGVGRDLQSDLPLVHHQVSRHHARFEPDGDGWIVRDLGSANGTFVNGVRVDRSRLSQGDTLDIGPVKLVFQEQDGAEIVLAKPSQDANTQEIGPPNKRLVLLYKMTRTLGAVDNLEALLHHMLTSMLELVGGERAMVCLLPSTRHEEMQRVAHVNPHAASEQIVVARAMIHAMLDLRQSVLIRESPEHTTDTISRHGIRSAMGAPLEIAGQLLGYLYLDDRRRQGAFGEEDLDFLNALARLASVAIDHAYRLARATGVAEAAAGIGPVQEILGNCQAIQKLRALITRCAASPKGNILIHGESGTGKELVARALHNASARAQQAFVAVNCAAIPDTMIEGSLFGHEKGAFTGATQRRRGQFLLADQGTLFLDEVGELSLSAQAKVSRALENGEVFPLGAEIPLRVDVRVIAATQKDLRREVAEGRFREDLFYRLRLLEIEVPPLRERGGDIELLAQIFLESAVLNLRLSKRAFSPSAREALKSYSWPGNVRELRNEVERALILAENDLIDFHDLSREIGNSDVAPGEPRPADSLAERFKELELIERKIVEEALMSARGNVTAAARRLGITRIMMRYRIERFGLRVKDT